MELNLREKFIRSKDVRALVLGAIIYNDELFLNSVKPESVDLL
jgi:hypothetical protein